MIKFYQYSKCSTCIKAAKFLKAKGVNFKSIEITEVTPSKSELKEMLSAYNGEIRKIFNTNGQIYKAMDLKSKIDQLPINELINLLSKDGKLVKRPFLIGDKNFIVGFNEDEYSKIAI